MKCFIAKENANCLPRLATAIWLTSICLETLPTFLLIVIAYEKVLKQGESGSKKESYFNTLICEKNQSIKDTLYNVLQLAMQDK